MQEKLENVCFRHKFEVENPWNGNAPAVFMKRKWDVKSEILLNSLCALLGASWLAESVHNVATFFRQVPSFFYTVLFLIDNLQTYILLITIKGTSHYLVPTLNTNIIFWQPKWIVAVVKH